MAKLKEISKNYRHTLAYTILAFSFVVGVWGMTERADNKLREDINKIVSSQCLNSRLPTSNINKFNDSIEDQIDNLKDAREINLQRGDLARARGNTRSIIRLEKDKVKIPTIEECLKPLLK